MVVAAHPDDEVIGVGGTIAKHALAGDQVYVVIVTEGASIQFPGQPEKRVLKSKQAHTAGKILGVAKIFEGDFPDQKLDEFPVLEIIQFLERIIKDVQPQTIYTHHFGELNQDHRVCHEATAIAARPFTLPYLEQLLCFSVDTLSLSQQGAAQYNVYVDIAETLETKIEAMQAYDSEIRDYPHPRSVEALRLMAARNGTIVGLKATEVFQSILEIRK